MVLDIKLNRVLTQTSEDDNTVYHTSACPLCKSESLITDTESGEVICNKCGMVTGILASWYKINKQRMGGYLCRSQSAHCLYGRGQSDQDQESEPDRGPLRPTGVPRIL